MGGLAGNAGVGGLGPQQVTGVRSSGAPPVTGQMPTGQATGGAPGLTGLPGQGAGGMYGPPPWFNNFLQMLTAARQGQGQGQPPQGGFGPATQQNQVEGIGDGFAGIRSPNTGAPGPVSGESQRATGPGGSPDVAGPQYGEGNRSPGWLANRGAGGAITNRMQLNQFGQPNYGGSAQPANPDYGMMTGVYHLSPEEQALGRPFNQQEIDQRRANMWGPIVGGGQPTVYPQNPIPTPKPPGLPDVGARILPMPGPIGGQMSPGSTSNFNPITGQYTNIPSRNVPPPAPAGLPASNPMAGQMNALLAQQIPGGLAKPTASTVPTQVRRGAAQPIF
jgi:hypothetical protein